MNSQDQEFVTVARIVRPQGRRGEVACELHTHVPERFTAGSRYRAIGPEGGERGLELESAWAHKGRLVLKFRGVDSINEAERLRGYELQVPRSERAPLGEEHAVYVSDLVGCAVTVTDSGRELGRIAGVQFGAGDAPLLVVQGDKEYLLPFAAEYLRRVDVASKRVEMALPDGMLELDAPLTEEEKRQRRSG